MKKRKVSDRQYETLALHATYDFAQTEGENADRLLCEIASNVDNLSKLKELPLDANLLASFVTERLVKIIKSRKFQASLKTYCKQEIDAIKQ